MIAPKPTNRSLLTLGPKIGLIEDDPILGESLKQRLELEGYRVVWWPTGEKALLRFRESACQILICDIRLPDLDGEQLFRRILADLGATPVIFITAFGEIGQAVRLMRAGADDYLTKPFKVEDLLGRISNLCTRQMAAGNHADGRETFARSPAMLNLEFEIRQIKDASTPVLLVGETGVGKELAARQLHDASKRQELPFIVVSCATIPVDRAEGIMFGYDSSVAFGSPNKQPGLIELAENGTLFLDEVSALPLPLQSKFLRLLEDGTYRKIGSTREFVSKARIISSTNATLGTLVAEGRFRADLYYRLNAIELRIPPLRARPDDIVPLSEHVVAEISRTLGRRIPSLTPTARAALCEHAWPGNIRELRNRLIRAISLSSGLTQLTAAILFPERSLADEPGNRIISLAEARERAERLQIEEALRATKGEIGKAATLLSISRTTLWEKMRRLGLS